MKTTDRKPEPHHEEHHPVAPKADQSRSLWVEVDDSEVGKTLLRRDCVMRFAATAGGRMVHIVMRDGDHLVVKHTLDEMCKLLGV